LEWTRVNLTGFAPPFEAFGILGVQAFETNIILASLAVVESLIYFYWSSASAFAICGSTVNDWLVKHQHAAVLSIFAKHFSVAQMFYHFVIIKV